MKYYKTEKVLGMLLKSGKTTLEIIDGIIPGYNETYRAMRKSIMGHMDIPKFDYEKWKRDEENKFYSMLYNLRSAGLIQKTARNKKTWWQITILGKKRLNKIRDFISKALPNKKYIKEPDNYFNVVIFDIPEKLKFKRRWLCQQLKQIGFCLLQKSVWIGKNKIPEELVDDLRRLSIFRYIHIFQILNQGTISDFDF
jgi:DNA-binding PadR family transcriptional regulator